MRKTTFGIAAVTALLVTTVAASVPRGPVNHGWDWQWHDWWHSRSERGGLSQDSATLQGPTDGRTADGATASQGKTGAIPHAPLLKTVLSGTANLEVAVYEAEYAPGGRNPRHLHPAAITFYVVSGSGVWQEEGQSPVTLHAGDSLLVPAGTIHSHWNPSTTEHLRFVEFIVAEKDKGRSIPQPIRK
jgi:quercetin dioxygenase-like cupin family protein